MKKFEFSTNQPPPSAFIGRNFYSVYKNAEFVKERANVDMLLSRAFELRKMLKTVAPGVCVQVGDMKIRPELPLTVKNTAGPAITVGDFEFTNNRLTGFVAAYVFDHRSIFPDIRASEALSLGLMWNTDHTETCKLYLSAVTGAEFYYDQFSYWPLVCALRKLQQGKITPEPVVKIARMKNNTGERRAQEFIRNYATVVRIWKYFPGSSLAELELLRVTLPDSVKRAFQGF